MADIVSNSTVSLIPTPSPNPSSPPYVISPSVYDASINVITPNSAPYQILEILLSLTNVASLTLTFDGQPGTSQPVVNSGVKVGIFSPTTFSAIKFI